MALGGHPVLVSGAVAISSPPKSYMPQWGPISESVASKQKIDVEVPE
jgi:hypothetical protein